MLIQCPSCHARTKLSDDHAGAKVRCAECGRVYVARASGAHDSRAKRAVLLLGGFIGVLAVVAAILHARGSGGGAATKAANAQEEPPQPGAPDRAPAR